MPLEKLGHFKAMSLVVGCSSLGIRFFLGGPNIPKDVVSYIRNHKESLWVGVWNDNLLARVVTLMIDV